ncbi:MAG: acyltransferase [Alphaproteobacteria bacterium]|nr:acyltransferase [Alphaproteobacteria bacterium]MBU0858406.1 acyltransferase [Alphaproteobacteria bacterium]
MKYSPPLDGLRALAAALVLLFHARVPGLGGGFLGVDIFFVLSGFLITRLLVTEHESHGAINYAQFTIRRFRRLYPALLFFLAGYLLVAPFFFTDIHFLKHLKDSVIAGLYMADYINLSGDPMRYLTHAWTLGVEVKFYLLWPLVMAWLMTLSRQRACLILALLFLGATLWRAWNVHYLADPWDVYDRFDTHISGLLLGALIGFANLRLPEKWWIAGAALLIITLCTTAWRSEATAIFGITAMEISALLLICACPSFLGASILPWLGRMSYGFYLWHYLVIRVARVYELDWPATLALGATGGLAGAALSYYTIERVFRTRRANIPL